MVKILVEDIITGRRSVRHFTEKKIENRVIKDIIDKARWAPTHCNTQQSRFIVIDQRKLMELMVDHGGSSIIKNAKQGILILYKNTYDNLEYKDYIQSAAAAIQTLCLYAYSKGIGTCWICHLPSKKILRKMFGIPSFYDPIAYIAIGYPSKDPIKVKRKYSLDRIVNFNRFNFKEEQSNPPYTKRVLRRVYYLLPLFIKKRINHYVNIKFVKKFKN